MTIKNAKHARQAVGYNTDERPKGDFYATPRVAIDALLEREILGNNVWEPACGDGAISKVLKEAHYFTISTDLYDWGYGDKHGIDFLTSERPPWIDCIITNPPFNISTEFVTKAVNDVKIYNGRVFILQRLAFLESKKRQHLFTELPFKKCLVFSKRLPRMHRYDWEGKKSTSMLAFAWFIWDWEFSGNPIIEWI